MIVLATLSLASPLLAQQNATVPSSPPPMAATDPAQAQPPSSTATTAAAPATVTTAAPTTTAATPATAPTTAGPVTAVAPTSAQAEAGAAAPQAPASPGDAVAASSGSEAKAPKQVATAMHELSPWSMFMAADIIVKAVMIGLASASLVTWTIFIAKTIELSLGQRRLDRALQRIAESGSLAEAQNALGAKGKDDVLSLMLSAAIRETRMSAGMSNDGSIKERAASSFAEIARAEGRRVRTGIGALATIGSTSPFVGLFGTVWGIMNSFIGISKSQTTNLAVVAPGIAEALLATAIGLVAAIPAVIIYNYFARVTRSYLELVSRASGTSGRLLSRDLDRTFSIAYSRAAE
jgi:biopolymer transport protein ExbB